MTELAAQPARDLPDSARLPRDAPLSRPLLLAACLAGVVAVAATALTLAPAIRFSGWETATFGATAAVAVLCVLPVHRNALASLIGARVAPELIGTVALIALLTHAARHLDHESGHRSLAAAAIVTLLLALVPLPRERAGSAQKTARLAPLALGLAALALIGWWLLDDATAGWSAALAVLAAACPAGVLLAPGVVLRQARARGLTHGAEYADPAAFACASRVDTVVLDKDHTVTTGRMQIASMAPFDPKDDRNLPWFAGALSHAWEHPIGRALSQGIARGRLRDVRQTAGLGIEGRVDKHPVRIGRFDWLDVDDADPTLTLGIEVDTRPLGVVSVVDTLRKDAREGVRRLRDLGVEVVLVSDGTDAQTASLADLVAPDRHVAEQGPTERLALVSSLASHGRVVACVGSPDQNAAALGEAELSVSTGGAAILMDSLDINDVTQALRLARTALPRALRLQRFAIGLGGVAVLLALAGVLGPLASAGAAAVVVLAVLAAALSR